MFGSSSNGIPSKAGEFGTVIRAVLLASTKNGSPIGVPVSGGAFDSRGCTSMGTSRLLSTLIASPWHFVLLHARATDGPRCADRPASWTAASGRRRWRDKWPGDIGDVRVADARAAGWWAEAFG